MELDNTGGRLHQSTPWTEHNDWMWIADNTAPHSAIEKGEKEKIKALAMQAGISEPVHALALQNALMIAKILRFEFPHDW